MGVLLVLAGKSEEGDALIIGGAAFQALYLAGRFRR
jgi:hypothetical protein